MGRGRHGAGETVRATPQGVGCHARRSTRPAARRGDRGAHRPVPGFGYRRGSGDPPGGRPVPAAAARRATGASRPTAGRPARTGDAVTDTFDQTPLRQHPYRWRLSRAGFVNVWHYLEDTFDISGGRLILSGTNGSGKSRALEMLLPFLLDADRRNMGTGSAARVEDLLSAGAGAQGNRLGDIGVGLCPDPDPAEAGGS